MDPFTLGMLENKGGRLYIGNVSVELLADKFGTPLYVIDEERVRNNFKRLRKALKARYEDVRLFYAVKANSSLSILKILLDEGAYLDVASPGELFLGLKAGYPRNKIMYTGTSVSMEDLKYAIETNVTINVDSLSEIKKLLKMSTPQRISVRINPEVGSGHHKHVITGGKGSKFGLWKEEAVKAYTMARKAGIKKLGVHMHIGSGILDINPFISAVEHFMEIVGYIKKETNVEFEFINIGGGLGVPYRLEEPELDLNNFSVRITSIFQKHLRKWGLNFPTLCLEPGRYLVCDAAILLTSVNTIKETPHETFIGVNAGFNTLIRPCMYGSYHHILISGKLNAKEEKAYDVVGPLCESGDFLAKNRRLPRVDEGDICAVLNVGAYGYSMSSEYNSRPKPAEVLVNNGRYELIRKQGDLESLMKGQKVASWLG